MTRLLAFLCAAALLPAVLSSAGALAAAQATTINLTDATWSCNKPLSEYGSLPITVNSTWTTTNVVEFGVQLGAQCVGDGNPATVDIVQRHRCHGIQGPYGDAIRVMNASPGARGIVLTGDFNCGRGRAGNHQDASRPSAARTSRSATSSSGRTASTGCRSARCRRPACSTQRRLNLPTNMRIRGRRVPGSNVALRAGRARISRATSKTPSSATASTRARAAAATHPGASTTRGRRASSTRRPTADHYLQHHLRKWPWDEHRLHPRRHLPRPRRHRGRLRLRSWRRTSGGSANLERQ